MSTTDSITVITLTRGRPALLERAIASVQRQARVESLQHMIIVDDCISTKQFLESRSQLPSNVQWYFQARESWEKSGPGRSSRLRNWGVAHTSSHWIAMLDDDNEFESGHLALLLACAKRTGCRAVHSWLRAFHRDGRPYTDPLFLWASSLETQRTMYAEMVAAGVFTPGSNIFKDRADPQGVRTVDTGEWLLAREVLLEIPFQVRYSAQDGIQLQGEDDKLLEALLGRNERIACSEAATLRYYLGGYSNNPARRLEPDFAWADAKTSLFDSPSG